MITLFIVVPLISVLILNLLPRKLADGLSLWWGLVLSIGLGAHVLATPQDSWNACDPVNSILRWNVTPSNLAAVMFISIALVVFSAFMTGRYLIADKNRRFIFNNLLILCMAGMNGVVLANDLFSLYVFLEIVAASSFVLISLERTTEGLEGAFKYLLLSSIATVLMLSSIALLFMGCGSLDYETVGEFLKSGLFESSAPKFGLFAAALFMAGLFIKGGMVPFHGWLPDAYSAAPTAASVLLGGIVTKVAGVFTLLQLLQIVFGLEKPSVILFTIGTLSIAVGAFAALGQKNFKRMLAYSSISQIGYIVIGIASANPLGIAGAIFHLFNHSIFKTLLFVNSAVVEKESGTVDMNKLGGLSNKMPVTGYTSILAFLSTAGIPPLSGFWSKLLIVLGVWQAGFHTVAIIAILLSLITVAYFLSMQRKVFFGKLAAGLEGIKEANAWALIPEIILAILTLGLGLLTYPWLFNTFLVPIGSLL